jgi:hypothetical protein
MSGSPSTSSFMSLFPACPGDLLLEDWAWIQLLQEVFSGGPSGVRALLWVFPSFLPAGENLCLVGTQEYSRPHSTKMGSFPSEDAAGLASLGRDLRSGGFSWALGTAARAHSASVSSPHSLPWALEDTGLSLTKSIQPSVLPSISLAPEANPGASGAQPERGSRPLIFLPYLW